MTNNYSSSSQLSRFFSVHCWLDSLKKYWFFFEDLALKPKLSLLLIEFLNHLDVSVMTRWRWQNLVSNCSGSQIMLLDQSVQRSEGSSLFFNQSDKIPKILDNRQTTRKVKFTLRIVIQTKKWSIIIIFTNFQAADFDWKSKTTYCLVWASRLRCLPRCPFPLVSPTKWEEGLLDHRLYRCLQSLSAKFAFSL